MMPCDDLLNGCRVTDIAGVDVHVDALGGELTRSGLEDFPLPAGDRNAGAVASEHAADLLADAGAPASDEGDLAREDVLAEG